MRHDRADARRFWAWLHLQKMANDTVSASARSSSGEVQQGTQGDKSRCGTGVWPLLKRRFHILHGEVRLPTEGVPQLVAACAVLHNLAIDLGQPDPSERTEEDFQPDGVPYAGPETSGGTYRAQITETFS